MTKDEALRILLGGKHYDSVEECQAELAEIAEMIECMTEVVRCKDCKHCEYPDAEKEWCKKWHIYRHGTWYCADGERKE